MEGLKKPEIVNLDDGSSLEIMKIKKKLLK